MIVFTTLIILFTFRILYIILRDYLYNRKSDLELSSNIRRIGKEHEVRMKVVLDMFNEYIKSLSKSS